MEEARGETLLWNEITENFIKDFKFIPEYDQLVESTKKIKSFIKANISSSSTGTHNRPNASCHNIRLTKIPQSTRLRLETYHTSGNFFQWKYENPETTRPIKTILKVDNRKKEPKGMKA